MRSRQAAPELALCRYTKRTKPLETGFPFSYRGAGYDVSGNDLRRVVARPPLRCRPACLSRIDSASNLENSCARLRHLIH